MSDLNIDDFYRDVALIFITLYRVFPRKQILYVDDISGADTPDEFGLPSDRYLACFSTMVWLAEEGYIRFESTIRQEALDQAVLTERGFLLLSSRSAINFGEPEEGGELPPSVQQQAQNNINQLRRALKSGSSIMIGQCVEGLLSRATARDVRGS